MEIKDREKNGNFAKGNKIRLGKKHPEETKRKIGLKSIRRKSMLGKYHTQESKKNISKSMTGKFPEEKNPMWKGNKVGYSALHIWILKKLGKPIKCSLCGETNSNKKYEWSNISKKYKRDLKDYRSLCISCHRKYDYKTERRWDNGRHEIKI